MSEFLFDELEEKTKEKKTVLEVFGVNEFFKVNELLKNTLFDEDKKNALFDKFCNFDKDKDFLRDFFQEEGSARKSFKQDYTPDCLCELVSNLISDNDCVYDECSGTGSLLIPLIKKGVKKVYCVELSQNVIYFLLFNLAIRNVSGIVFNADVLTNEIITTYQLEQGDKYSKIKEVKEVKEVGKQSLIISNPPYSLSWSGNYDNRCFGFGIPPKSKADFIFILDIVSKLEEEKEAFIILPHGVLFRGAGEQEIRKSLLEKGYIKSIIGLPQNLFLNTGIPVFILHLKKSNDTNRDVFFIDASKHFQKSKSVNILTKEHIEKISGCFKLRKDEDKFSRLVGFEEIQKNDYNLNIPRYVDTFEKEEIPELKTVVSEIVEIDNEIKIAEKKLAEQMKMLVGENYQNDIKEVLNLWT